MHSFNILDTERHAVFDEIVNTAAMLFDVPIAVVSLVDENRQWFKAVTGLEIRETPRNVAFCAHAIQENGVLVVPDAQKDRRFSRNPLVRHAPKIRFYAGAPLKTLRGLKLGTLCLMDRSPRSLSPEDIQLLEGLGQYATSALEQHRNGKPLHRIQSTLTDLLTDDSGRNLDRP